MLDVHIINMEKSRDKWDRCSRRFREKGFRVLRQEGYDVTTMDLSGYYTGVQKNGALGCQLSHRALWKRLLESSSEYFVIAEDDAVPLESAQVFVDQIRKLPQDIDFVHFGCGSRCKNRPFIGTHCYLVTRSGAQKYLSYWKNRIDVAVDQAIGQTPNLRLMRVKPEIASFEKLTASNSDIVNTNNPLTRLFDHIPCGKNKTLGYDLFYPRFKVFGIEITVFLLLCFVFAAYLFKYLRSGTKST